MRILMWNPTYVLGGGMSLLVNIVAQLRENSRVDSVTVALNSQYEPFSTCHWSGKIQQKFIKASENIQPFLDGHDVVYMTWPHGLNPPQVDLPTVCVFQDTILLDAYGAHSTREFLQTMEREIVNALKQYTRVIVTSEYTRRRLVELIGPDFAQRVDVLPHIASGGGVESRVPRGEGYKRIEQLIGDRKFLFYPANVSEHKNHINLFYALSKRSRRDVQLVLCGYRTDVIGSQELEDSAYVNRLNKVIRDRKLQANVDYFSLGYVDDAEVECLWDRCLGLIMPTRAEGMGLPIHEAIERGLPVITSDIEVLREHFGNRSESILWVDPESPSEIAAAWDYLCDENSELRIKAKDNRTSRQNWAEIVDDTVMILQRAQAQTSRGLRSRLPNLHTVVSNLAKGLGLRS